MYYVKWRNVKTGEFVTETMDWEALQNLALTPLVSIREVLKVS